jgi:hypothetical protein
MSFSFPDRITFLVGAVTELASVRKPNCCGGGSLKESRKRLRAAEMSEFIFCRPKGMCGGEMFIAGCTAVGSMALASAGVISPAGAVAACVPIIIPMTNSLIDAGIPISDDAKRSMTHMMGVNSAQLSFGLIEFLMGDITKKEFLKMYYNSTNDYKFLLINNNSSSDNSNMDEIYGVIKCPAEYIKK